MEAASTPAGVMKHRLQEDTASEYLREAKHFYEYYDFIKDEHVRSSLTKLPVRSKIFIGVGLDRKIDFAVYSGPEVHTLLAAEERGHFTLSEGPVAHSSDG